MELTDGRGFPEVEGIPNFGKLDDKIYRGGQPRLLKAFSHLASLGVKRVICLRFEEDTPCGEATAVIQNGMEFYNVGFSPIMPSVPSNDKIEKVFEIVESSPGPVFIHCQYGCERTGLISACWRIRKCGWTAEAAQKEADTYGMSEYFVKMREFILGYR